jgi:hypothetical protein
MKFIAYWEFEAKDTDKVSSKYFKMSEIRKKPTDLYPKSIFPSYYTGPTEGFLILEGDDHQLANYTLFYFPEMRITYVPLIDAAEVAEKYQKLK